MARAASEFAEDIYLALIDLDQWMTIGTLASIAMRASERAGCPRKIEWRMSYLPPHSIKNMREELSWLLERLPTVLDRGQLCHLIDHLINTIYEITTNLSN